MEFYKIFRSSEFVNRQSEINELENAFSIQQRGVFIFEGDRGSGKTSLALELFRRFLERSDLMPFFVGLLPYHAPEFENMSNCWLQEKNFEETDISNILGKLTTFLNIQTVQSNDINVQKEYLARDLALNESVKTPVLLVDSIYECGEEVRQSIERYLLTTLLTSKRIFIVLTGRGKRPIWGNPDLQNAEIRTLEPLIENSVRELLEKTNSEHKTEHKKISRLSGGYPLIVRILGQQMGSPENALDQAIKIILSETLVSGDEYQAERHQIEKLALLAIPFRVPEIEDYLYGDTTEEKRLYATNLIKKLLDRRILKYENGGYQLNLSIAYPIRQWFGLDANLQKRQDLLGKMKNALESLKSKYPEATQRYQKMAYNDFKTL